jgi:hypothetical protein
MLISVMRIIGVQILRVYEPEEKSRPTQRTWVGVPVEPGAAAASRRRSAARSQRLAVGAERDNRQVIRRVGSTVYSNLSPLPRSDHSDTASRRSLAANWAHRRS